MKTCIICGGKIHKKDQELDAHFLCKARKTKGLPTPKIEERQLSHLEAEQWRLEQAKELSKCWGVFGGAK